MTDKEIIRLAENVWDHHPSREIPQVKKATFLDGYFLGYKDGAAPKLKYPIGSNVFVIDKNKVREGEVVHVDCSMGIGLDNNGNTVIDNQSYFYTIRCIDDGDTYTYIESGLFPNKEAVINYLFKDLI